MADLPRGFVREERGRWIGTFEFQVPGATKPGRHEARFFYRWVRRQLRRELSIGNTDAYEVKP